ncbi:MAG TPA: MarR family transcriptional regulator [Bacteroides sp.]|nr:MarR family transcriptional regulator [Bacteroides sp.]
MHSSYLILKHVIDLLALYEQEESQQIDLEGFAEWMIARIKERPGLNKRYGKSKTGTGYAGQFDYVKNLDEKSRFLECISRISRLHDFYIRKYLEELPVNSRLEYLFLSTVGFMEKSKKTDLINIHIVEYTTGMDTIRRLVEGGLLQELPDEYDRRAKLLTLTAEGKKVLEQANQRLQVERNMFLACTSYNKWKKHLPVLEEINELHYMVYSKHADKPPAELSNLMDSLKHLYK